MVIECELGVRHLWSFIQIEPSQVSYLRQPALGTDRKEGYP
jgi:hypothetical protein